MCALISLIFCGENPKIKSAKEENDYVSLLSIFFISNVQGRLRSTSERAVRPTTAQQAVLPYSHGLLQEQVSPFSSM